MAVQPLQVEWEIVNDEDLIILTVDLWETCVLGGLFEEVLNKLMAILLSKNRRDGDEISSWRII